MQAKTLVSAICFLLSVWILAVPFLFPPCVAQVHGMGHMSCWYTGQAELFIAIMAILVSSYLIATSNPQVRKALGLVFGSCGIIAAALPQSWALGMCGKESMACHMTYRYTMLGAIPLFVLGISIFCKNFCICPDLDAGGEAE